MAPKPNYLPTPWPRKQRWPESLFQSPTSVPKFLNPGPAIRQIWESDSSSDSGYNHRSNRNLPMFLPKKWPHRLLLLLKWKSDSGSGFSKILTPDPKEKFTILPESTPDPDPPLPGSCRNDVRRGLFIPTCFQTEHGRPDPRTTPERYRPPPAPPLDEPSAEKQAAASEGT